MIWSCVWSLQVKLGTITTRLRYRQTYQHLFLIGCCDGQLPLNSLGFAGFLGFFLLVHDGSRHSKFVVYSSGPNQPSQGQQSEGVWCWKTKTSKDILWYITEDVYHSIVMYLTHISLWYKIQKDYLSVILPDLDGILKSFAIQANTATNSVKILILLRTWWSPFINLYGISTVILNSSQEVKNENARM